MNCGIDNDLKRLGTCALIAIAVSYWIFSITSISIHSSKH
jgi:hypothetical protein